MDTVSTALHPVCLVCSLCAIFFSDPFHSGFTAPSFFLGTIPFHCLGCPHFLLSWKHTWNWQWSDHRGGSFIKLCPYDEEETAIWFRLIEAQFAATGIKSQCFGQPAQASPWGHFRHRRCLQWFGSTLWSFERCFAWAVWQKQETILFWVASAPHGNVRS